MAWSTLVCTCSELAIVGGHLARAINTDDLLVELANFNHHARLVPFSRVWASLVLDSHMVANC